VAGEADVRKLVEDKDFMQSVRQRFAEMNEALYQAMQAL